jgi:hypothetical protein
MDNFLSPTIQVDLLCFHFVTLKFLSNICKKKIFKSSVTTFSHWNFFQIFVKGKFLNQVFPLFDIEISFKPRSHGFYNF